MGENKKINPAKNDIQTTKENIIKILNTKEQISKVSETDMKTVRPISELDRKWDMNDKIINSVTESVEADRNLRFIYAVILVVILGLELIALTTVFILTGRGILQYSDTTLNIFLSAGIAEVFVLIRVIVKYLFKDNLIESLNIILKNNNVKEYNRGNYYKQNNKDKNDEKQNAQNNYKPKNGDTI